MAYCTIDDPTVHMNITLWTGNNAARSITGLNHAPAMLIIKSRSNTSSWYLFDKNRGTNALFPDDTAVESDQSGQAFTSLDADGMTFNDSGSGGGINSNALTYCGWSWAGGTTSGITTTGADITPSAYSFNHTSRFSAAAYTGNGSSGAKIAHGLGAIPEVMIIKPRDRAGQAWVVYHHKNTSAPQTDYLALDAADATADGAWPWNDAVPTSVYLETQSNNGTNASGNTFALYTFRGVQGYSKFGSYIGNGGTGTDGPFVYTGFRPAFVMIKSTASGSWLLFDSKRASASNIPEGTTGVPSYLEPNTTGNEQGDNPIFLLSNGFQCLDSLTNQSGVSYIYMAFAEQPFVNSNGVPCNAR